MLSNIFTQIKEKYENLTQNQLFETENRLEDEYVQGELMWKYKKEQIIRSWAELMHWKHDHGSYPKPISTISSYIKNRLRIRGVSEGAIDYVSECLVDDYSVYKDSTKDTYKYRLDGNPSRPSVFENFEEMALSVRTKSDLEELTPAEFLEVADIIFDKDKEIRARLRQCKIDVITVAQEKRYNIARLNKESAKDPPDQFWGQSDLYFNLMDFGKRLHVLGDYVIDTAQLVYKFRPRDDVSKQSSKLLWKYCQRVLHPMTKVSIVMCRMVRYAVRGAQDEFVMPSDAKNCQPLLDWMKTGYDKEVNSGSHGAGVLHAIQTGQYIMELGKDGRSVLELPIEREFTREQCNDKIPKLLLKARNILAMHECEKLIQEWSKKTEFEVITGDPEEFYRREMARKGRKIPDE